MEVETATKTVEGPSKISLFRSDAFLYIKLGFLIFFRIIKTILDVVIFIEDALEPRKRVEFEPKSLVSEKEDDRILDLITSLRDK